MSAHPIPDAALDDRQAFVGTSGSGKTYNAGTAVERLQALKARTGIVDPLGGWWGLRLLADGKRASPYKIVIFGGPHGDLPLTENAGQLIGETCATMAESFILDLSELGTKASERRFMLAFLTALYRKTTGEPLHLIVDEADMFAPQMVSDKDGDAVKLLGVMETIVRRGRIKGFIPWLITQRPAVLNKNVLSQADGLIAMKLTSSQDRTALGDWIEGQADRAEGKRILAEMPTLQLGQGVVWIPGRGILETADFPKKQTFDSSRTPKRGEAKATHTLKPLDVGALKDKLAKIETEVAASDPKKLKQRVAELEKQLRSAPANPEATAKAREEGHREGKAEGWAEGHAIGFQKGSGVGYTDGMGRAIEALVTLKKETPALTSHETRGTALPTARPTPKGRQPPLPPAARPVTAPSGDLTGPEETMLSALAFWAQLGKDQPDRAMVAAVCGWRITSGHIKNVSGSLRTKGLIEYPSQGEIALTTAGASAAPPPPEGAPVDLLRRVLSGPQRDVLALLESQPKLTREEICERMGWSADSGHIKNVLGSLRTLQVINYPSQGVVAVEPWVFETA